MSAKIRPDVHRRFLGVVERGLARADREIAAERARIRRAGRQTAAERRPIHTQITSPRPPMAMS